MEQAALILCEQKRDREQSGSTENVQELYKFDPLGFVMAEWPWGVEGGPLADDPGPDENQCKFLTDLGVLLRARNFDGSTPVAPVKMSISSANGTGKSTLGAFLAWFILRTRPMSVGTVSSGNFQQLEERIWADIMHWGHMSRGAHEFDIQKSGIFRKDPLEREKWKVTPKTAARERAHSFAGQHSKNSTSWILFDESSDIVDEIWKESYTCLTDGEPMMFAWGQMLQNSGEFFNVTFGGSSKNWNTRVWDGQKSKYTNKQFIADWAEEYGEDSDYYRVHALGLPPRASSLQFIGQDLVDVARKRVHNVMADEPLVWGYDAANGGLAKHCFFARRGLDAKSIPPIFLPGDTPRDVVVAKAAELMSETRLGRRPAAMFGDQAFGAVIIVRLQALGYTNVFEVNFGDSALDKHFLNMRAQMWSAMKDWMMLGAIPDDEKLAQQFMGPGFGHRNGKLVIESKQDMAKRGVRALDGADALALTFARKVAIPERKAPVPSRSVSGPLPWAR